MTQTWPVAFQQVIVGVQKVGDLRVSSPQLNRDQRRPHGRTAISFVLGNGPALPAGGTHDAHALGSAVP